MTRDDIAKRVHRVIAAIEAQSNASKKLARQLKKGETHESVIAEIDASETEVKAALIDIGVDTLHVLHRIADALEGKSTTTILAREKL